MGDIREQAKAIHRRLDSMNDSYPLSLTNEKDLSEDTQALLQNGYVVIRNLLSPEEINTVRQAVAQVSAREKMGRNNFEGRQTVRVYGLPAKTRATDTLILHPRILRILDDLLLPNPLLSAMQAINIHPGETPQPFHTDGAFIQPEAPYPKHIFGIATVWAITDFTAENGATQVIPGSHTKTLQDVDFTSPLPVEMPAGSVVVFPSNLWHGGGKNVTANEVREAITFQYCQPYLRPQENVLLGVDPAEIEGLDPRLKSMFGLSIHPPFIGHFNGLHPLRSPWIQRGKL